MHTENPTLKLDDDRPAPEAILASVGRVRFASVDSLLALWAPRGLSRDTVRAWVDAGLLRRGVVRVDPLRDDAVEYVALTPKGARLVSDAIGARVAGVSSSAFRRSSQKRAHDLAVGDLALAVLALSRDHTIELLGLEVDDKKLATAATIASPGESPQRVPLQADALMLVAGDHGPIALLVEVDRGTTSPARMARKYAAYLAWKRDGGPERDFSVRAMRVLTLVPDERRLKALHDAALRANDDKRSGFLLFATASRVSVAEPLKMLAPMARALGSAPTELVPLFSINGTSKPPGVGADRRCSGGAPEITQRDLGTPAPRPRLPAAAAPPTAPVL